MKKKSLLLCFMLICACVFPVFALVGCGNVSIETIKENFVKMDAKFDQYDTVFIKDQSVEGFKTDYAISYGAQIDAYIQENKQGYGELKAKYNLTLAIACDHIKNNRTYIENLGESGLDKAQRNSLDEFNSKLVDFTNYVDDFVRAKNNANNYFTEHPAADAEETEAVLRKFKNTYADFVGKSVETSRSLAKVIESVDLLAILEKTQLIHNDLVILKEYLRAKLLPVYSDLMITTMEKNLNWRGSENNETKARIDNMLTVLQADFSNYKDVFVLSKDENVKNDEECKTLYIGDIKDQINAFFSETDDCYFKALEGLDIRKLAVNYHNDLENYKKDNKLAEVYLEKLENYISVTLPKFITNMKSTLLK